MKQERQTVSWNAIVQPALQQQTLRLYGEFLCRQASWSGELALAAFPGAARSGFAAAGSLAGAASLTVDSDATAVKAHFRDGAFDFVVNTLDEALRALKNEIRLHRSIAIGLIADPSTVLEEAAERGLVARLILTHEPAPDGSEAKIIDTAGCFITGDQASSQLIEWLDQKGWRAAPLANSSPTANFPETDPRAKWLKSLPTHQRSSAKLERWSWVDALGDRLALNANGSPPDQSSLS